MARVKILFLDVGTHKAQELKALNASVISLSVLYIKRALLSVISRHRYVPSLSAFCGFLVDRYKLFRKVSFTFVAIEPNWRHGSHIGKANVDHIFYCALTHETSGIVELYHNASQQGLEGQAATLVPNSLGSVKDPVLGIDALKFFAGLEGRFGREDFVVLRLNNEGFEDVVINAALEVFRNRVILILGSLDDVRKKFGDARYREALGSLASNNVGFIRFSPLMTSWPDAISGLLQAADYKLNS